MSTKKASTRVTSVMSFGTFSRHFVHCCYILRAFLGAQLAVLLLLGIAFAWCEDLPFNQGIYFSLITSTTVGYGDITPKTGLGQCISVGIALGGTIHFGLVVALATQAFTVTIKEYMHAHGGSSPKS